MNSAKSPGQVLREYVQSGAKVRHPDAVIMGAFINASEDLWDSHGVSQEGWERLAGLVAPQVMVDAWAHQVAMAVKMMSRPAPSPAEAFRPIPRVDANAPLRCRNPACGAVSHHARFDARGLCYNCNEARVEIWETAS